GVLGAATRMVLPGIALGVLITLSLSSVLRGFLYGVSPTDPGSLALTIAVVAAAALLASYLPARLASRADPVAALRAE
ncbi:MAG: hypothetical protein OEO23_06445, partial [Gemmatimonadota bacterium]|nr:hypothetical protein [Gemmatimonadota bacterium]